jgi:transcription elongation GreA/GreB family factor
VVESSEATAGAFAFGHTAQVLDESTGRVNTWTLVGATEADFGQGKLSIESPVGQALQDTPIGEAVSVETPRGEKTYRVQKLIEG